MIIVFIFDKSIIFIFSQNPHFGDANKFQGELEAATFKVIKKIFKIMILQPVFKNVEFS